MSIEEKLSKLRAAAESAKQKKLRAEMAAEHALKEREEALETLKAEFGIENIEEAEQVLQSMRRELEEALSDAESILKDIV